MGVFKMQPSEVYELDAEDIRFFRYELDIYIKAMNKAGS